jgi:hypothetical protein
MQSRRGAEIKIAHFLCVFASLREVVFRRPPEGRYLDAGMAKALSAGELEEVNYNGEEVSE